MLGKDLYKVESNVNLSSDDYKSLVIFYAPLIGPEALTLYEHLLFNTYVTFNPISDLINSLNYSIDRLESALNKLNEYRLLKTLKDKSAGRFIFVLNEPLDMISFSKDDIFVRDFIKKTSGAYYQSVISELKVYPKHNDNFIDVSAKLDPNILENWTKEDESYLKNKSSTTNFEFNTFFNVNIFLKDVSTTLLPLSFRTNENMKELATLADIYNISYDKMRTFIPKVFKSDSNTFDLNLLRYLCEKAVCDFKKISDGNYNVPCQLFLMNKQEGKELTSYDKKIIYNLAHEYHLTPAVINVILEYSLKKYDNRLIEKYIYPTASDMHRANISDAKLAINRINNYQTNKGKTVLPTYSSSTNPKLDEEEFNRLMNRRNTK